MGLALSMALTLCRGFPSRVVFPLATRPVLSLPRVPTTSDPGKVKPGGRVTSPGRVRPGGSVKVSGIVKPGGIVTPPGRLMPGGSVSYQEQRCRREEE